MNLNSGESTSQLEASQLNLLFPDEIRGNATMSLGEKLSPVFEICATTANDSPSPFRITDPFVYKYLQKSCDEGVFDALELHEKELLLEYYLTPLSLFDLTLLHGVQDFDYYRSKLIGILENVDAEFDANTRRNLNLKENKKGFIKFNEITLRALHANRQENPYLVNEEKQAILNNFKLIWHPLKQSEVYRTYLNGWNKKIPRKDTVDAIMKYEYGFVSETRDQNNIPDALKSNIKEWFPYKIDITTGKFWLQIKGCSLNTILYFHETIENGSWFLLSPEEQSLILYSLIPNVNQQDVMKVRYNIEDALLRLYRYAEIKNPSLGLSYPKYEITKKRNPIITKKMVSEHFNINEIAASTDISMIASLFSIQKDEGSGILLYPSFPGNNYQGDKNWNQQLMTIKNAVESNLWNQLDPFDKKILLYYFVENIPIALIVETCGPKRVILHSIEKSLQLFESNL